MFYYLKCVPLCWDFCNQLLTQDLLDFSQRIIIISPVIIVWKIGFAKPHTVTVSYTKLFNYTSQVKLVEQQTRVLTRVHTQENECHDE